MLKAITMFKFSKEVTFDQLNACFEQEKFVPCTGTAMESHGFAPFPKEVNPEQTFALKSQHLVAGNIQTESKILPGSVVNQFLVAKIAEVEEAQSHPVGKRQKRELKEEVIAYLLPKAFSRFSATKIVFDLTNKILYVGSTSTNKVDTIVGQLNKAMADLNLARIETEVSAASLLTSWLASGEPTYGFTLDRACVLKGADGQAVTFRKHDLDQDTVNPHLTSGKVPSAVALDHESGVSFVLTDERGITKFNMDGLERENADDAVSAFAADLILFGAAVDRIRIDLIAAMGGESPAK